MIRVLASLLLGVTAGCSHHAVVDTLAWSAPRHARPIPDAGRFRVLAGDLHCHVSPPDAPGHVSRDLSRTVALARREGLDFLVLTPHLWGRFDADDALRERAIAFERELREGAALVDDVVVVVGFEYTTHLGHVGAGFASLEEVLAGLSTAESAAHPGRFFERYVAAGGVLVINHPYLTPFESPIRQTSWDLSWKAWTRMERLPPELRAAERVALGIETHNLGVRHLRDGFYFGDPEITTRATTLRLRRQIARLERRRVPVGGSDSHSDHLRAMTFVLAEQRSERAIADALRHGRVCAGAPGPCSLEARAVGGPWHVLGAALSGDAVEVRARARLELMRDGETAAWLEPGRVARVPVERGRCTLLTARGDGGASAPVYVNCPFAEQPGDRTLAHRPAPRAPAP